MKKTAFSILALGTVLAFGACSKDDNDGIMLQAHDANRMMDSMHVMMDRMMAMPMTKDPDIDFAKMMVMHHQGAIGMAQAQRASGSSDTLKRFSQKVITDQQMEITELQSIVAGLTADTVDEDYHMEQMSGMEKTGKVADLQIITGDIDNDFARMMMVHHQGAIDDASGYLHHGSNAQLKDMAKKMITAQTSEIIELSNWLKSSSSTMQH
jgi:uncharacterized protein (DUF305 family)